MYGGEGAEAVVQRIMTSEGGVEAENYRCPSRAHLPWMSGWVYSVVCALVLLERFLLLHFLDGIFSGDFLHISLCLSINSPYHQVPVDPLLTIGAPSSGEMLTMPCRGEV